jgi:glycosidase
MRQLTFIAFILSSIVATSQIVSIDPPIFDMDEEITITYDASLGSGGLANVTPVFAHTGVITASGGPGNWQFVQGNWGTFDSRMLMTPVGNQKHELRITPREFYGFPPETEVVQLAFVFRNRDGSREGKTADLSDIFVDVVDADMFSGRFVRPDQEQVVLKLGETIDMAIALTQEADISLQANGVEVASGTGTELAYTYTAEAEGNYILSFEATNSQGTVTDEVSLVVIAETSTLTNPPVAIDNGVNIISDSSLILMLTAPDKENVFLLSNLTDYKVNADYQMNLAEDEETWWIEVDLPADGVVMYQYLIDGTIRIADPYSILILDKFNDTGIAPELNSVPAPYPDDLTSGHITYFDALEEDYDWQHDDFVPAPNDELVIYELLVRDFVGDRSFNSLIDSLSYLKELGINAIELMPVSEFENNQSWGYNPSYHMALDKYYGSRETFKRFVDEAHRLDIAVFLDIVYNHAFGQSPLVRMYWDAANSRPHPSSPYLNPEAKHPFNVGFDFNHLSEYTKDYTKQTIDYWIEEFKVDGFRFDLSKGFTQNFSDENGAFSAYDASRIAILSEYADHIWDRHPNQVLMLEHFASNGEETELADYGFLLWGNANFNFNEATMGYNTENKSDFGHIYHPNRGWNEPHLIGYMESHDEERLMYKNIEFGNSDGSYTTRDLGTGLDRCAMASAFFFSIPGPKMIWQFGELGYEFSINRCEDGTVDEGCRLSPKPIRWDYLEDERRKDLYDVYATMLNLKANYPAYTLDATIDMDVRSAYKSIQLSHPDGDAVIVGNFDVKPMTVDQTFSHDGTWTDHITGETIEITGGQVELDLAPGEFHVYLDNMVTSVEDPVRAVNIQVYPNPATDQITIDLPSGLANTSYTIYSALGDGVLAGSISDQTTEVDVTDLAPGVYFVTIRGGIGQYYATDKVVIR